MYVGRKNNRQFFGYLLDPADYSSMPIGKALTEAQRNFTFGFGSNDDYDRKTVNEYQLYGVPWATITYPDLTTSSIQAIELSQKNVEINNYRIEGSFITASETQNVYTKNLNIIIDSFNHETINQDGIIYDAFSISGGDIAIAEGVSILPYIKAFTLPFPQRASILDIQIFKEGEFIGYYNIPNALVKPWVEGGLSYTEATELSAPFPEDAKLVQFQATGEGMLFTVFPIQHNPDTDETNFYSQFNIQVSYKTLKPALLKKFSADRVQYVPGETIQTNALIENITDKSIILNATLSVIDGFGEIVGSRSFPPFSISSGNSYNLGLLWDGYLDNGCYTLQIKLINNGTLIGGGSEVITIVDLLLENFTVPKLLQLGDAGNFEFTLNNLGNNDIVGNANIIVRDNEGNLVRVIGSDNLWLYSGDTDTVVYTWKPQDIKPGIFTAIANFVNDYTAEEYGPITKSFIVPCKNDFDRDGDVDGSDLATLGDNIELLDLSQFSVDFGITNCPLCD